MAKLHLDGGVTFEGTPEEIKAYTDLYAEGGAEKAQEKPEPVPSFKEGDIVVITGNTTMSANEIGDIGVIAELGEDRFVVNVKGRRQGRGWTWTVPEDVRHATQAERQAYEDSLMPKPKFSVGDYVMPTEDYPQLASVTKGEKLRIERVIAPNEGGDGYVVSGGWSISEKYLTEYVEPSVFERIGREEGEFKVGDIINYTDGAGAYVHEVLLVDDDRIYFNCTALGNEEEWVPVQYIELIAPVESRVDRSNRGDAS